MRVVIFACAIPNYDNNTCQFYTSIKFLNNLNYLKNHTRDYFISRQSQAYLFKPVYVGDFTSTRKNIILSVRNNIQSYNDYKGYTSESIDLPIGMDIINNRINELKDLIINNNTIIHNFEENSFNNLIDKRIIINLDGFSYKLRK